MAVAPPISVDPRVPDTDIFIAALRPWWLDSLDGTTSYSDLVLRFTDRELYRAQRDHAEACHDSSNQHTLLAATASPEAHS